MRIGIDARFYGPKDTGIGRYVQNLTLNLGKIDKVNQYIIFGGEIVRDEIKNFKNAKNKTYREENSSWLKKNLKEPSRT